MPKLELEQKQKLRVDKPALLVDKHRLARINPRGLSQQKDDATGTPRTNNKRQAQIKENKHSLQALKLQVLMLRKVPFPRKRMQAHAARIETDKIRNCRQQAMKS